MPCLGPERVDYNQIARFEIAADHFDIIAVVQAPGDTYGSQLSRLIDPYSAPTPALAEVAG
jgi:hypothetical protein